MELAGYAEDIFLEVLLCCDVGFGGEGGVKVDVTYRVDLYAISEDCGCSVFFDLTLNTVNELATFFVVVKKMIGGEFVLLGCSKVAEKSTFINAGCFVVVATGTLLITVCGDKMVDNEIFNSTFFGVGWHCSSIVVILMSYLFYS